MGNIITEVNAIFSCMYPFIYNELQKKILSSIPCSQESEVSLSAHPQCRLGELKNNLYIVIRDAFVFSSDLFKKYGIPDEIKRHTIRVGMLGVFLFFIRKKLQSFYSCSLHSVKLFDIVYKIARAGFLHDIAKIHEIRDNKNHAEHGYEVLMREKLIFEALACRNHLIRSFTESLPEPFKIINFADKCVIHSKYATVKERLIDLDNRYPHHAIMFTNQNLEKYEQYQSYFNTDSFTDFIKQCNNIF